MCENIGILIIYQHIEHFQYSTRTHAVVSATIIHLAIAKIRLHAIEVSTVFDSVDRIVDSVLSTI